MRQGVRLASFSALSSKKFAELRREHGPFNTYTAHPRDPTFPSGSVYTYTRATGDYTISLFQEHSVHFNVRTVPFDLTSLPHLQQGQRD